MPRMSERARRARRAGPARSPARRTRPLTRAPAPGLRAGATSGGCQLPEIAACGSRPESTSTSGSTPTQALSPSHRRCARRPARCQRELTRVHFDLRIDAHPGAAHLDVDGVLEDLPTAPDGLARLD